MSRETLEEPDFEPAAVIGPSWDQCPEEWRREPEPAAMPAEASVPVLPRLFNRLRIPAAMALSAAAGQPVGRNN